MQCPATFSQTPEYARCEFVGSTASTPSSSSSASQATNTPSASDQASTTAAPSSSGISTGVAAGIGVVSGLAVLCLAAVGTFIYARGKRKGELLPNAYSKATVSPYPDTLVAPSFMRVPSEQGRETSPARSWEGSELDRDQVELLEFPAGTSSTHAVPELPTCRA
jgi:hypothetical protein